jgi:hypothetical protein
MDEQRILEEMERMLAADDPRLAARLAAFGQPGVATVLHTRRARAAFSLMTLGLIACVALVIYMVSVFHMNSTLVPSHQRTAQPTSSLSVTSNQALLVAPLAVPLSGAPTCTVLIASGVCAAWSSSSSAASHASASRPSSASSRPAASHPASAASQPSSAKRATAQKAKT